MKAASSVLLKLSARKTVSSRILKFSTQASIISNNDVSIKIHKNSITSPEEFWGTVGEDIAWFKKPDTVLDSSKPPFYRWYVI
jgi:hypothetical protein